MKASEIIKALQSIVDDCGDREVEVNGAYSTPCNIHSTSFLEITDIDIYPDSDNIQVIVKNC